MTLLPQFLYLCACHGRRVAAMPTLASMRTHDSDQMAELERKIDYLIRYLGIDPACVAAGIMPAGSPTGLPTGDGLPLSLAEAPPMTC
jgi:hypothetical protein